ncbi:MAG: methyl-accepting chemotaxis protein [Sterolibacterium sp.]|jgi:methyl-accepting chemotaxis protein
MNALLKPAVELMNRLRYPRKFALLGSVALIAVAFLQITLYRELSKVIEPSRLELTGIAQVKALNKLIQNAQQHRGLSSGVLSGNESLKQRRTVKEKEVAAALTAVVASLPAAVAASSQWQNSLKSWETIRTEGMEWTSSESFARHTGLIDSWLQTMIAVADETALSLDPDIDSYYLMDAVVVKFPAVLERLGQIRARGTGILTKKAISDIQRMEIGSLLGDLEGTLRFQRINVAKVMNYSPANRALLGTAAKDFDDAVDSVTNIAKKEIMETNFALPAQEFFDRSTKVIDRGYAAMDGILFPALQLSIEQRIANAQGSLYLTIATTVLVGAVFAYLAIGAYLSMVVGVRELGKGAEQLAQGILTERVMVHTRDELLEVSSHFNRMADNMQDLLRKLQTTARDLGASAQSVSQSARNVASSSGNQSDAASSMAAAIQQMTASIDRIAENARTAQTVSTQSGDLSVEGGRIVDTTVREMQVIADTVRQSAQTIEELGRRSDEISAIVNVIKEIAEQTNLLALNAAIEAARAGEQGRGFAVVADEVRKLAERTSNSTQEISAMIATIQQGTAGAVETMRKGMDCVAQGVALSQRAGQSIRLIEEGAIKVRGDITGISEALREQSAASNDIAAQVERVAQMAESNNAEVKRTAATAGELERLSVMLQSEVARFSV